MILLYNWSHLPLTFPLFSIKLRNPNLKSFIMGQSLTFDKCIPTLEVFWVCFGFFVFVVFWVFLQIILQAFMCMVCHCLLSPPWWISKLNVKPSAELESHGLDPHRYKEVLWARIMPYKTCEKFPEIVTVTLLEGSPPLLACRNL